MNLKCGYSSFSKYVDKSAIDPGPITVDCGKGYIGDLKEFGFLYEFDKAYGAASDGEAKCNNIENPLLPYKY